jgi:hypothetical protein
MKNYSTSNELMSDDRYKTTILNAIKHTVDPANNENLDAKTFGDGLNLTIAEPSPSTITNVCGSIQCVVVLFTGRPDDFTSLRCFTPL